MYNPSTKEDFVRLSALSIGLMLSFLPPLGADSLYTYTGNNFNFFVGPGFGLTSADSVSISLTFTAPLADNLPVTDESSNVVSWSATDGVHTITNVGGLLTTLTLSTNSNGSINSWFVFACSETSAACDSTVEIVTTSESGYEGYVGDFNGLDESSTCCNSAAFRIDDQGAWTGGATAVPEPGSLVLVATAFVLAGTLSLLRRRGDQTKRA
jgi:hypothetical protein